jgi:DNA-binding transcriptional MerR regulator
MTPKLYKAADVCDMTQLQPYVLRSWEKEFPGIGVQKSQDSPRLYRQSDVEQVLRIKQLVFGEGLTLSGARRRLEESAAIAQPSTSDDEVAEVLDALASDARTRIAHVRDGLRSILKLLSSAPGTVVVVDDYRLEPPPAAPVKARALPAGRSNGRVLTKPAGTPQQRSLGGPARGNGKPIASVKPSKSSSAKRSKRASA